jgi:NAD-dependent deacetylase
VSRQSSVVSRQSGAAERLAELIRESSSTAVLTGAGISVPSGIPDFRSPGTGLWEKVDPMQVAHIHELGSKAPNGAHAALAELESRGLLDAVITQNIDRLHQKAGSRSVIEVHGSIQTSSCTTCGASYALDAVEALFDDDGIATCGCMGKVKPDVVLFGEFLPEEPMDEAQRLCESCDLLICVGSSLEVYPVAGLPSVALNRGARLAIVTQGPTPYDRDAAVKLEGDVVDELGAVLAAL